MLSDKKNFQQNNTENEQLNNSIREINNHQNNPNNIPRGFNIFLSHGISPNELRALRILYHLSTLHNSIVNHRNMDWSAQAMFQREENWLRTQMSQNHNIQNNINYNRNSNRNRNAIILRNPRNNSITLYISHGNFNRFRQRRYYRNNTYEPNINFLQGFIFGFVLNIFALCIMLISRPRPKFKIGLVFGMILSISITFPFMLDPHIKYR